MSSNLVFAISITLLYIVAAGIGVLLVLRLIALVEALTRYFNALAIKANGSSGRGGVSS